MTQTHDSLNQSQDAGNVKLTAVRAALAVYVVAHVLPAVQTDGGFLFYGYQLTYLGLAPAYRLLSGQPLGVTNISLLIGFVANCLYLSACVASLLRCHTRLRRPSYRICVWVGTVGILAAVSTIIPVAVADRSLAVAILVPTALPDGSMQPAAAYFPVDLFGDSKWILSFGHVAWLLAFALLTYGTRGLLRQSQSVRNDSAVTADHSLNETVGELNRFMSSDW